MGCLGGGKSNSSGSGSDTKFKLLSVRWEIAADPIGEGGFGSVHLATNRKTGKVLRLGRWLSPRLGLRPCLRLRLRLRLGLHLDLHLGPGAVRASRSCVLASVACRAGLL